MLVDVPRFEGGTKWMGIFGVLGVVCLAITLFGMFTGSDAGRQDAWYSYQAALAFAVAVGVGGLLLLQTLHATNAKWPTVLRRPVEAIAGTLPLLLVLALVLYIFGMNHVFSWFDPQKNFSQVELHHFHGHKSLYLGHGFFYARQAIYWFIFLAVSTVLLGWSKKLDEEGGHELIRKSRALSAGAIPIVGLALTWLSFDWLMSLTPFWQSTIFGVYYWAGGFLAAIAVVTISCLVTAGDRNLFGWWLSRHHHHNLGKLLLAIIAFWAYAGFSQLLLVWIGNIPEEVPYYWVRLKSGWVGMSTFIIFGHFALPFVLLLPRTTKLIPKFLLSIAIWILFVCMVDVYWMVLPAIHEDGPHFSLYNFTAFLGICGVAVAFAIWRLRGRYMIPVRDPYLEDSLRYAQP